VHVAVAARGVDWSNPPDECDERGMMVLLVKHVHLQNDGGEAALVDTKRAQSVRKIYTRFIAAATTGSDD